VGAARATTPSLEVRVVNPLAVVGPPTSEPELLETREGRCPVRRDMEVAPAGHVTLARSWMFVRHRSEVCPGVFAVARKMSSWL
jgi:hypothetical protein